MAPELKFCGLTRGADVGEAVRLGAAYVGVVFAPSPRRVEPADAPALYATAGKARKVGVFGADAPERIAEMALALGLDVAQLHGDPSPDEVEVVRRGFPGKVWAVARVDGAELPSGIEALAATADALVLDARATGALGGTGRRFDWEEVARRLGAWRDAVPIVLAGGLRADNVAEAVRVLAPDVVDVSSGVERSPGNKDHDLMMAFADAVRGADFRGR